MNNHASLKLADIALNQLWLQSLLPTVPLLADVCQLSLGAVRQALPSILTTLQYQVLTYNKVVTGFQKSAVSMGQFADFMSWVQQAKRYDQFHRGVTFAQLNLAQPNLSAILTWVYPDTQQLYVTLGALMTKVGLTFAQLMPLFRWVVLLAMVALQRFLAWASHHSEPAVLLNWLMAQPILAVDISDDDVMRLSGLSFASQPQRLRHYQQWQRDYIAYPNGELAWLTQMARLIDKFLATRPFAITPYIHSKLAVQRMTSPALPVNQMATKRLQDDIFQPVVELSFADRLQQHWIATAGVLSLLIFSGLGWAFTHLTPKTNLLKNQSNTLASKGHPQVSTTFQDVAIVRVASVPDTSAIMASTAQVIPMSNASKAAKATTTNQTTDKDSNADDKKIDNLEKQNKKNKQADQDNDKKAKDSKAKLHKDDTKKSLNKITLAKEMQAKQVQAKEVQTKQALAKKTNPNKDKTKSDAKVKSTKQSTKAATNTVKVSDTKTTKSSKKTSNLSKNNENRLQKINQPTTIPRKLITTLKKRPINRVAFC